MKRFFISLLTALFIGSVIGQGSAPLITIPGNNLNFDFSYQSPFWSDQFLYHICWENQTDSVSTIYLKQVYPSLGNDIVIYSDTSYSQLPQITFLDDEYYRIAWLNRSGDYWRILSRTLNGDSLGQIVIICDSINSSESFSMNYARIAFIDTGRMYIKAFLSNIDGHETPILVDSGNCSNPVLTDEDAGNSTTIVYVKETDGVRNIYRAYYRKENNIPTWSITQVSSGENDINPQWGLSHTEDIVYQSNVDGFWRIQPEELLNLPDSLSYNCANPRFFRYEKLTKKASGNYTPFFVIFDSDSIPGNREIFWNSVFDYLEMYPDMINLSNIAGDDRKPQVMATGDSLLYFWEHEADGKTDIWWFKDEFNPDYGAVQPSVIHPDNYTLDGNYPNPFNPSTYIRLKVDSEINQSLTIKIYDLKGALVRTIPYRISGAGNYNIPWDGRADNCRVLPAGIYLYQVRLNGKTMHGKMMMVK
ncbi:MAG: FlgD immunoglobulin-like domain containing protein [Candidatus Neomarinimicrobiota bacterium]